MVLFLFLFFKSSPKDMLREEKGEKERKRKKEKHISVKNVDRCLLYVLRPGIEPST